MMEEAGGQLEQKAEAALNNCLTRIPFVKNVDILREPNPEDLGPDLMVKAEVAGQEQMFVVEMKNNGQPRPARDAINQLLRIKANYPGAYGVFIAPYISPRTLDICAKEGVGCVDLAGNCRLSFGNVYIEQEGKPNIYLKKRDLRSLYSPRAERVLRVLLNNTKKIWKVQDLAIEASVSLGQAFNVKKLLEDREWIRTGISGFSLSEPEALLKEWAENYSYRKNRVREMYSIKGAVKFESELADICSTKGIKYALSGFSGAARLAARVRYQRAMAYIASEEDMAIVISQLNLKEVGSRANISLLLPYDDGIFYGAREVDGVKICSPVQIYLDLIGFAGRGEEAAVEIFEQVLKPSW